MIKHRGRFKTISKIRILKNMLFYKQDLALLGNDTIK